MPLLFVCKKDYNVFLVPNFSLPVIGALFLAGILGYIVGRNAEIRIVTDPISTEIVTDNRPKESVVIFEGVRDGKVFGSVRGEVRVWIGDNQIMLDDDGFFAEDPGPLIVNEISVLVPDGMKFVASKRGRKYYKISSNAGQRIVPGNRVYFRSANEAEMAGYRP